MDHDSINNLAAPADTDAGQAIDLSVLSAYVNHDLEKVRRHSGMFIELARETLAEMNTALDLGDLAELARLGHLLQSSACTVGAERLAACCRRLEDAPT